tara:strand:+ start:910 stop:1212 length:303 start_codon:yes stop_codon:yes gene_type:complete
MEGEGQKRSWARKRFNQALEGGFAPNELIETPKGIQGHFVRYHLNEVGRNVTIDFHTEGDYNGDARKLPGNVDIRGREYPIFYREVPRPVYEVRNGSEEY